MQVSELIGNLVALHEKHGDLEVITDNFEEYTVTNVEYNDDVEPCILLELGPEPMKVD